MEKISKNFAWMAAANLASSIFNIILFIYLARVLMPEAFGYYSYALAVIAFLANFVDPGLSTFGIRQVARDAANLNTFVREIVSFRIVIAAALCALTILAALLLPQPYILKVVMAGSSLLLFMYAFAMEWAFQGMEQMHMVFASFAVTSLIHLALASVFVKGPKDVAIAPILYLCAHIPIMAIFLRRLKFRFSLSSLEPARLRSYLSSSLVIWSISLFAQVYNGLDIPILGLFRGAAEVGYFTVARRIIGGITFLLIFLANAALPRLVRSFADRKIKEFFLAMRSFIRLCAFLTFFIFLPIIIFSRYIITAAVGSEYLAAGPALVIMMAGLILVLFNLPYSTALIAACRERDVLKQTAGCAALSLVLNFGFIPKYGMIGASVSFLITEGCALIWILFIFKRRITCEMAR